MDGQENDHVSTPGRGGSPFTFAKHRFDAAAAVIFSVPKEHEGDSKDAPCRVTLSTALQAAN